ncbi:hypothetical protein Poli38472_013359 [Pythium oligandrum]|uniref:Uncharacterized protein n=1 Tax=Pythium oligandrum TaxID=41045 RepID=A0A8K1FC32_PYTOL|nr:hypothetical protein Poli38472_013359 [Pythium oligandrum]|eukprot:TMW57885.1 hypothetical protein Poli38472_013359 [Pythium oligandrum]
MAELAALTSEKLMEIIDVAVCMPLALLMNFSLFQYLLTTFYRRRREPLVCLLLFIAFLSFFSLIPFGFPDLDLVRDLNDISEVCSVLTFLLQISILTRDINKKMKFRFIRYMMVVGELLVLFGLIVLTGNAIDLVAPGLGVEKIEFLDEVTEGLSLVFIVVFRFTFLAMAKGYRTIWRTQKTEIAYYLLFLTHEYPFMILDRVTGLSWEHVQGVWMRFTIILCLWSTIKARISSKSSKFGRTTGALGPSSFGEPVIAGPPKPSSSASMSMKRTQVRSPTSVVPFQKSVVSVRESTRG